MRLLICLALLAVVRSAPVIDALEGLQQEASDTPIEASEAPAVPEAHEAPSPLEVSEPPPTPEKSGVLDPIAPASEFVEQPASDAPASEAPAVTEAHETTTPSEVSEPSEPLVTPEKSEALDQISPESESVEQPASDTPAPEPDASDSEPHIPEEHNDIHPPGHADDVVVPLPLDGDIMKEFWAVFGASNEDECENPSLTYVFEPMHNLEGEAVLMMWAD